MMLSSPPTRNGIVPLPRRRVAGFTLIELMIVVVIVGILASVAIPSYTGYVQRSHRTLAKTALADMAARQERHYSRKNAYSASLLDLGYTSAATGNGVPVPDSGTPRYWIKAPELTRAGGYRLRAERTGAQAEDPCGTYVIDSVGRRQVEGATLPETDCW